MKTSTMRAIALDHFGGEDVLCIRDDLPIPELADSEVLVRVQAAGVGEWDPFEREGGYAKILGREPRFPYVLGSEGAGVIAARGDGVDGFEIGQAVYAVGFLNPKGGFYAEYAAVRADMVAPIPRGLSLEQAASLGGVGITALRGLDGVLGVKRGDALLIFGASGGIGHVAIQLAKHRGARVLAIASGDDGVALAARLGADAALDGHRDDVLGGAHAFAPDGFDGALFTAGGSTVDQLLETLREGATAAYPNGIEPEPRTPRGRRVKGYDGDPEPVIFASLQRELRENPITVNVAQSFPLERAADAHRALGQHYLGKLALRIASNL
jgi:NADPH:quinone reductase-like Zn-dependent oxidoreductase